MRINDLPLTSYCCYFYDDMVHTYTLLDVNTLSFGAGGSISDFSDC